MYTETSVVICGPRERIFALGAGIEDWPRILPHYRAVTLSERTAQPDGTVRKIAVMKAWRPMRFGKIPVGWKTIQESNAATERLHFVHIGGFTKGMDVYWLFTPEGDATRVTITHDFTLRWPLIGDFVAHRITGQFFVDAIARRTLRRIKEIVESDLTPQPSLHRPQTEASSAFNTAMERGSEGDARKDLTNITALAMILPSPSPNEIYIRHDPRAMERGRG